MLITVLFCCTLAFTYATDEDGYSYEKPPILFGETFPTTQCPSGYTGQYPNCVAPYSPPSIQPLRSYVPPQQQPPSPQQCPSGTTGQYPYCQVPTPPPTIPPPPPPRQCPSGTFGQYPNCQVSSPPPPQQCPSGTTGQYPYCQVQTPPPTLPPPPPPQQCPFGTFGQYPYCQVAAPPPPQQCPFGTIGNFPNCQVPTPTPQQCAPGTFGQYPYCQVPAAPEPLSQPQQLQTPLQCPVGTIGQYPYCLAPPSNKYLPAPPPSPPPPPPSVDSCLIGWDEFKTTFNKKYKDVDEELNRQELFLENQQLIAKHNALYKQGKESYSLCVNQFADWTDKEYENINGIDYTELPFISKDSKEEEEEGFGASAGGGGAEEHKDWRDVPGVVTPVKDQGDCASCWAFSATGALESHFSIKKRSTKPLSEQQLMDCTLHLGNKGCNKGFYTRAFAYTQSDGIFGEAEYPRYEAKENMCRAQTTELRNQLYRNITAQNEEELKIAVRDVGPVSVALNGLTKKFKSLGAHGVYFDPQCGKKSTHAVLVIGYGFDSKLDSDYWLIKNSYGTKWGDAGYARIARNKENHCGIANYPAYPIV